MSQFEAGKHYEMRFLTDADLLVPHKCLKRTAQTAVFKNLNSGETFRRRIKSFRGEEYIKEGSYSMPPTIYAKNRV